MTHPIRRLITGHDENGKAICINDGPASCILSRPERPGVSLTNLWQTNTTPAEFDGPEETVDGPLILHPPENGAVFRIVEFEPEDPEVLAGLDGKSAFSAMGAADNIIENARHPFMHRTDTVDFGVVIAGEIYMMLDEEDHLLKAGDTFIQRGTNHAWSNRGTETCRIAFVLVDGVASNEKTG
jgi:mannose-6-phosphate isomerase-like protein (cupin superfamily)